MKKVFIDTSVLIAACKSRTGGASYVLMQCRKGLVKAYISRYVIYEAKKQIQLNQVEKQRLNFFMLQCKLLIGKEPTQSEVSNYYSFIESKDAPIVAAAKSVAADYLITLNTKDFMSERLKEFIRPIQIITPKKFIQLEKNK